MTEDQRPVSLASRFKWTIQTLLWFCMRGLILGMGGGFAWLAGMAIAQFFPAPVQQIQIHQHLRTDIQASVRNVKSLLSPSASSLSFAQDSAQQATNGHAIHAPDTLMVTLPGDLLFQTDPKTLHPDANDILSQVVQDLQNYSGAAIQVAAHVYPQGNAIASRDLSMRQAIAVQQYMAASLGDTYHWVVVGYGQNQPAVDGNAAIDRQRNHRIEILIQQ